MTMTCKICNHPKRLQIDREVVKGKSIASIAKNFDVNYNGLYNHQNHISRQLTQVYEKRELQENMDLLGKIDKILTRAEDIFQRNYDANKDGLALKALAEQRSTIDLLARISYNLHQAKLAELELQRHQSGDIQAERRNLITTENLKVLNPTEQTMLKQLLLKMGSKDKDMEILPHTPMIFPKPGKDTVVDPVVDESEEKVGESDSDTESDNPLRVKPINSTPIPSTKWKDHSLNRMRKR